MEIKCGVPCHMQRKQGLGVVKESIRLQKDKRVVLKCSARERQVCSQTEDHTAASEGGVRSFTAAKGGVA